MIAYLKDRTFEVVEQSANSIKVYCSEVRDMVKDIQEVEAMGQFIIKAYYDPSSTLPVTGTTIRIFLLHAIFVCTCIYFVTCNFCFVYM